MSKHDHDHDFDHRGRDHEGAGADGTPVGVRGRWHARVDDERGDVPGWVLVTVMTAGIVGALLKFAQPELVAILTRALSSVAPVAS
jgi:hypothetical protein